MQNPPVPECNDKLYATDLALTSADQDTVIATFSSDASGTFTVAAAPGEYVIRSANRAAMYPRCSTNGTITVTADSYATTTVSCDTGIR
jgi:hypothetical protein